MRLENLQSSYGNKKASIFSLVTFLIFFVFISLVFSVSSKSSSNLSLSYNNYYSMKKSVRLAILADHFKSNSLTASYIISLTAAAPDGKISEKALQAYFKTPKGNTLNNVIKLWEAISKDQKALEEIDSLIIKHKFYDSSFLPAVEHAFAIYITQKINMVHPQIK